MQPRRREIIQGLKMLPGNPFPQSFPFSSLREIWIETKIECLAWILFARPEMRLLSEVISKTHLKRAVPSICFMCRNVT